MQQGSSHPGGPAPRGAGVAEVSRGRVPALAAAFLVMLCLPLYFSAGPIALSPVRLFLLVTIVPTFAMLLAGRYGRITLPDILLGLHILWSVLVIAIHHGSQAIQFGGSVAIELYGAYLLGRATIRSPEDFRGFARFLGAVVLFTLPFALYEALTNRSLYAAILDAVPGTNTVRRTGSEERLGLNRAQVMFAHPIHYGMFAAAGFSFYLVAARSRIRAAGAGIGSFLSVSSGAFLVFLMQVGLLVWRRLTRSLKRRWLVLSLLFAVFYAVVEVLSNRSAMMVLLSYATYSTHNAYWRTIIFEWGMQSVWAHPLFGIGLNDWERPEWMVSASVDNFWLLMAMRYGIPGFGFLALAWGIMITRIGLRKTAEDPALDACRLAWTVMAATIVFALATVHIFGPITAFVMFLLGSGGWLWDAEPATQGAATESAPEAPPSRYSRFRRGTPPAFSRALR